MKSYSLVCAFRGARQFLIRSGLAIKIADREKQVSDAVRGNVRHAKPHKVIVKRACLAYATKPERHAGNAENAWLPEGWLGRQKRDC